MTVTINNVLFFLNVAVMERSAYVVVVGDIGRSPRMCNHAVSLANEGFDVTMVGYLDSKVKSEVTDKSNITLTGMTPFPPYKMPRILSYVLKVIWQSLTLWMALPWIRGPDYILLQNPPGIPSLIVLYMYCLLHGTTFVLDWHNYGFSIMALTLGQEHWLVKTSKFVEKFVGSRVQKAFCVSNAMKRDLSANFGVEAVTLYDRAPDSFKANIGREQTHDLFLKLATDHPLFKAEKGTVFTESRGADIVFKDQRPGILVSSTSWTEDEDFSILIEALQSYEEAVNQREDLPQLVCVITGKGPLKQYYCDVIKDQDWKHVQVVTPWLEPDDYPKLLATADLGVCLHTSSSGVDLPMKIVDMFGCGLPVAAKKFEAIDELVQHNGNGMIFETSEELSRSLVQWFSNFSSPSFREKDEKFRKNVAVFGRQRWNTTWKNVAKPLFCTDG